MFSIIFTPKINIKVGCTCACSYFWLGCKASKPDAAAYFRLGCNASKPDAYFRLGCNASKPDAGIYDLGWFKDGLWMVYNNVYIVYQDGTPTWQY